MAPTPVVIPLFAMLIPVILVPAILALRYARLEREFEHAERMKALELGQTLPQDQPWWSPPRLAVALGAVVPVGVFFFAWMASQSGPSDPAIWMAAAVVGLGGVISGGRLARAHFEREANPGARKPHVDADSFDVVGSRG